MEENENNSQPVQSANTVMPQKPQKQVATPPQTMRELIMSQKASGSWQLNAVASLSVDQIKKHLSSLSVAINDDVLNVWMTAVVIAFLTTQFKDQQVNWDLVVDKARKWIKREEKRSGITVDWETEAIKFLQSNGLSV